MAKIETYRYKYKDEILPHMRQITIIWVEDTQKDLDAVAAFTGCNCKRFSDNTLEVYTRPNIGHHIHVGEATFVFNQAEGGIVEKYCYNIDRNWLDGNYEKVG